MAIVSTKKNYLANIAMNGNSVEYVNFDPMTAAERDALDVSVKMAGRIIFVTDEDKYQYYSEADKAWKDMGGVCSALRYVGTIGTADSSVKSHIFPVANSADATGKTPTKIGDAYITNEDGYFKTALMGASDEGTYAKKGDVLFCTSVELNDDKSVKNAVFEKIESGDGVYSAEITVAKGTTDYTVDMDHECDDFQVSAYMSGEKVETGVMIDKTNKKIHIYLSEASATAFDGEKITVKYICG